MTERPPPSTSSLGQHCDRCASAVRRVASPSVAVATLALAVLVEHHTEQAASHARSVGALLTVAACLGCVAWLMS